MTAGGSGRPEIRPAREDEIPIIAAIHRTGWQTGYRGMVPDQILDGVRLDDVVGDWHRRWAAPPEDGHEVHVAESVGVVGFCSLRLHHSAGGPIGEVQNVHVLPEHRSLGIGAQLLTRAESRLRGRGCAEAFLWVIRDNDRAQRFYERQGWAPDGAVKSEPWEWFPVVELRFRRQLEPGSDSR